MSRKLPLKWFFHAIEQAKALVFFINAFLLQGAEIVKVEGAEAGRYDHLRIYTQTAEQKEEGLMMLYKVYAEEVEDAG